MSIRRMSAARNQVTARDLEAEYRQYADNLRATSQELNGEIANIKRLQIEIREDYTTTALSFVNNAIPELHGEGFDRIAEIGMEVPQLGGRGLTYYRQRLLNEREAALSQTNADRADTIDANGFAQALAEAESKVTLAATAIGSAKTALSIAVSAKKTWEGTDGAKFIKLEEQVTAAGSPLLSPENRGYYTPSGLLSAMWRHVRRDDAYRTVREALVQYKDGLEGRDIFADMDTNRKEGKKVAAAVTAAEQSRTAALEAHNAATSVVTSLNRAKGAIKSDDEILTLVREKVTSDLATIEFMNALAQHFGEDFPRDLPLMSVKMKTLAKLLEGAQEKNSRLSRDIHSATDSLRTIARQPSNTEYDFDLAELRRQNTERVGHYGGYTQATRDSLQTTRTYTPPANVHVDNSNSGFWDYMIIDSILNSHRHSSPTVIIREQAPAPVPNIRATADLFGINSGNAKDFDLDIPADTFRALPAPDFDLDDVSPTTSLGSILSAVIPDVSARSSSSGDGIAAAVGRSFEVASSGDDDDDGVLRTVVNAAAAVGSGIVDTASGIADAIGSADFDLDP